MSPFDSVVCPSDALIVLDIDDTLITFPAIRASWWKNRFDELYLANNNNYDIADEALLTEWESYVSNNESQVQLTDEPGLRRFFERNTGCIVLVTARRPHLAKATTRHLAACGLMFDDNNIFHVGNADKGEAILSILQQHRFCAVRDVVFVDDQMQNIKDVRAAFVDHPEYRTHLYHYM